MPPAIRTFTPCQDPIRMEGLLRDLCVWFGSSAWVHGCLCFSLVKLNDHVGIESSLVAFTEASSDPQGPA